MQADDGVYANYSLNNTHLSPLCQLMLHTDEILQRQTSEEAEV